MTYVVGFSSSEVVDVTPRYVVDLGHNRMRRDQVGEEWLTSTLRTRREALWEMQGPAKAEMLR